MLYKNLPADRLRRVIWLRFLLDWVAAFSFLLKGNAGEFRAVIRAHREYRRWRPILRQKRAAVNPQPVSCIYPKSLLVAYHLRRQKRFSQLDL